MSLDLAVWRILMARFQNSSFWCTDICHMGKIIFGRNRKSSFLPYLDLELLNMNLKNFLVKNKSTIGWTRYKVCSTVQPLVVFTFQPKNIPKTAQNYKLFISTWFMSRVVLGQNNLLTHFELRAQNLGVYGDRSTFQYNSLKKPEYPENNPIHVTWFMIGWNSYSRDCLLYIKVQYVTVILNIDFYLHLVQGSSNHHFAKHYNYSLETYFKRLH